MQWFRFDCLRVAISSAHSKLQRDAFRMCGAHWMGADPLSFSNTEQRVYKFTRNTNTCKHILPLRMTKATALSKRFARRKAALSISSSAPKASRTSAECSRLRMVF
ncbi:hypothetical protein TRVL_08263 [Trypanosoma vivax]|nr:hypothetical protein TRVL_08263 [Trypanosoma vivax]